MKKRFIDFYMDAVTQKQGEGGGGGSATLIDKSISANGTYNASSDNADGYKKVVVSVPNSYTASDEGKVVKNGALASQSNATYTQNDTYDTTDIKQVTVNVPSGGGGAEIIIPDNSLGAYIEGEGEPMDAQAVVNWYDLFDPTANIPCTFQGATPSVDDYVLLTGDVLSSIDYTTVVGRYAIWGVCGSSYDGIAIQFSEALGYSVVDEEMPMNETILTAENDTGSALTDGYTNESGNQTLTVHIPSGGGGGGENAVYGTFQAVDGGDSISVSIPTGKSFRGFLVFALLPTFTTVNKQGLGMYYDTKDGTTQPIVRCIIKKPTSGGGSSWQAPTLNKTNTIPSSASSTNVVAYDPTTDTLSYYASTASGSGGLLVGDNYQYVIFLD